MPASKRKPATKSKALKVKDLKASKSESVRGGVKKNTKL